jgi:hypothetical protein
MHPWQVGLPFALVAALGGCSSSTAPPFATSGPEEGGVILGEDAGFGGGIADGGSVLTISDSGLSPSTTPTLLYAHDNTTLYRIDPTDPTLSVTSLGTFDCIGGSGASSMTDIAVDDQGNLFGLATRTIFLDMQMVTGGVMCESGAVPIVPGSIGSARAAFYGASFAPAGTLGATGQALVVGNDQGEMYVVDPTTGALTVVGTFGTVPANDGNGNMYPSDPTYGGQPGSVFQMSGDIVFLDDGSAPLGFATVRDCASSSSCSGTDTLVELDLSKMTTGNTGSVVKAVRGQVLKAAGCGDTKNTSYGSMYGVAAYENKIIGFSHAGFIVSISNDDGTACLIHDYSGTIAFDGAGVTTRVPVVAPPIK